MKLQHVEVLIAIADAGSLRGAAERLGKSQPALTKILRQVEENLGEAVFHRSSGGVSLTGLGKRILSRCRSLHSEINRLNDEVRQLRGEHTGELHVCVSPLAAIKIIPRALEVFHKTYPNVRVHLSSGLFPNALKPLREGRIDLLLGPTPLDGVPRDVSVEKLMETPVIVITSTTSRYRSVRRLADLANAPWIVIGASKGPGDTFRHAFEKAGLAAPAVQFTSESYFGALALLQHLDGVCMFPERLLPDMQKSWDLVKLDLDQNFASLKIAAMTRAATPLTPAAEALLNCIRRRVVTLERDG